MRACRRPATHRRRIRHVSRSLRRARERVPWGRVAKTVSACAADPCLGRSYSRLDRAPTAPLLVARVRERDELLPRSRRLLSEAPWLILPVVICLSQRLSHACLSACRIKVKPRMAH